MLVLYNERTTEISSTINKLHTHTHTRPNRLISHPPLYQTNMTLTASRSRPLSGRSSRDNDANARRGGHQSDKSIPRHKHDSKAHHSPHGHRHSPTRPQQVVIESAPLGPPPPPPAALTASSGQAAGSIVGPLDVHHAFESVMPAAAGTVTPQQAPTRATRRHGESSSRKRSNYPANAQALLDEDDDQNASLTELVVQLTENPSAFAQHPPTQRGKPSPQQIELERRSLLSGQCSATVDKSLQNCLDWENFNVMELERVSHGHAAYWLCLRLYEHYTVAETLRCSPTVLRNWTYLMESYYRLVKTPHRGGSVFLFCQGVINVEGPWKRRYDVKYTVQRFGSVNPAQEWTPSHPGRFFTIHVIVFHVL